MSEPRDPGQWALQLADELQEQLAEQKIPAQVLEAVAIDLWARALVLQLGAAHADDTAARIHATRRTQHFMPLFKKRWAELKALTQRKAN